MFYLLLPLDSVRSWLHTQPSAKETRLTLGTDGHKRSARSSATKS